MRTEEGILLLHNLLRDLLCHRRVVSQHLFYFVTTLTDALAVVAVPGTALLQNVQSGCQVHDLTVAGDALAVDDFKFCFTEWRSYFVFHNFHADKVAHVFGADFNDVFFAHIQTDGRVEFQSATARGGFRVAVHDADLLTQLIDEDDAAVGFGDGTGQLTQSLRHQTSLQTYEGIAHFAFDFGFGGHGCNRVHNHNVNGIGTNQCVADFQSLLAGIRLGNQQRVDVHAQCLCVNRVESMLYVDEDSFAAGFLCFGYNMESNGGFTGAFRAIDLNDTASWHAADTQRNVQRQRAGRDGFHIEGCGLAQFHNSALTELFFDLGDGGFKSFCFFRHKFLRSAAEVPLQSISHENLILHERKQMFAVVPL